MRPTYTITVNLTLADSAVSVGGISSTETSLISTAFLTGPSGSEGEQGEQGIQGIQGVQGEQGEQGEDGPSGLVVQPEEPATTDVVWLDSDDTTPPDGLLPIGGATNEVLAKASATDYDADWMALTKSNVGLGNVDNTSDANKPVSTAQATAINAKFTLPALTSGSVLFSDGTTISQDNAALFWDITNDRLGVGTTAPSGRLHVSRVATGATASNYRGVQVSTDNAETVANSANEVTGLYTITRITGTNDKNLTSTIGVTGNLADMRTSSGATGTITNMSAYYNNSFANAGNTIISNGYGLQIVAATNTGSGSITKMNGVAVANQTAGTNNTNVLVGTVTAQSGNYSVYSASSYTSSFVGGISSTRITPRTGTVTSNANPTINTDNVDFFSITAQSVNVTSMTTNLSGTPTDAQKLWIAITDNGTPRTITWGASFESSTYFTLPGTTLASTRMDIGFVWNAATSKWRMVA